MDSVYQDLRYPHHEPKGNRQNKVKVFPSYINYWYLRTELVCVYVCVFVCVH